MDTPSTSPWRWPRFRGRWVALAVLIYLAIGLARGVVVNLDLQASGFHVRWGEPFVWELTSNLVICALLPLVQTTTLNAPWGKVPWPRFLGLHLLGAALFWVLHVAGLWSLRIPIYRILGWGAYHYGEVVPRVLMEGGKDLFAFASLAALFHFLELRRERQARELAHAQLESELREARLQALSAQLDPHFLFNALDTLSAVMYEDVERADGLLSDLGLMLRDNLQAEGPTWPLQRELEHLDHYLAFVRARFGDRVRVELDVEGGLGNLPVPRFALQRLVENSLKHNEDEAGRALAIHISARREAASVRLAVADDGVGFAPSEAPGLGLENLRRSLGLLHGDRASLRVGSGSLGGAEVALSLPVEASRA